MLMIDIIREECSRLIEKRSHPETNKKVKFMDFFNENKDKFKQKNMFLSFRDDLHVTNINLDNRYKTPTGFYSYPLCYFNLDDITTLHEFRKKFPYASEKRYLYLYELNTDKGVINNDISFDEVCRYIEKIRNKFNGKEGFDKIYKQFYNNELGDSSNNAKLLYDFIYKVSLLTKNHQSNFTNICNSVGINVFIDNGTGYIHPNEPYQAVFFSKLKQNGVLKIYDTKDNVSNLTGKDIIKDADVVKEYDNITICKLGDEIYILNKKGELIYKNYFMCVSEFVEGFSIIINTNGKYNYINTNGKFLSNQWFDRCYYFKDGFSIIIKNKKFNIINTNGELISNEWFDYCTDFSDGFSVIVKDKKFNFINTNGEIISNEWFDDCTDFSDGFGKVEIDNKHYYIDKNGKLYDENKKPIQENKSINLMKRMMLL